MPVVNMPQVPSPIDAPALIQSVHGIRYQVRNVETGPDGRQIQIEDPDGNAIELFEPAG